jgi:hypothetical protein
MEIQKSGRKRSFPHPDTEISVILRFNSDSGQSKKLKHINAEV